MRGRPAPPDLTSDPPVHADAPIAATPAQMTGMMGRRSPRPIPWALLSLFGQGGGLVLLFVGTLVDVIAGSYPADCFTTHCSGSVSAGVQYAILVARTLWTAGAFGIASGAGIQLHFVLHQPESNSAEENARFLASRRAAFCLLLVGIGILLTLLLTQGAAVAPAF